MRGKQCKLTCSLNWHDVVQDYWLFKSLLLNKCYLTCFIYLFFFQPLTIFRILGPSSIYLQPNFRIVFYTLNVFLGYPCALLYWWFYIWSLLHPGSGGIWSSLTNTHAPGCSINRATLCNTTSSLCATLYLCHFQSFQAVAPDFFCILCYHLNP